MESSVKVVEGIEGRWHYHLRKDGGLSSLCGKSVMPTRIPLEAWGVVTHLNEHYCAQCLALAQALPLPQKPSFFRRLLRKTRLRLAPA